MKVRMPASFDHPTCSVTNCGSHFYPFRPGPDRPHLFTESIPVGVSSEVVVVFRALHDHGRREAYLLAWDGQTWSDRLPLPPKPRKAHAAAVSRARRFVRTGVLVP